MTSKPQAASYEPDYGEPRLASPLYLFRHLRRWTQAELAERAGLTQETISRLERGLERPRTSTRARLAEALGFDAEVVFPEEAGSE